jgi:hypothetical protein
MSPYERMGSAYNIQTKRGCRHRCIYCTYGVIEGTKVRLRPPVEVVDELEEALFKYQPESFEFVDSVFNDPLDHCSAILEEIARRPWKAPLTAMGVSPKGLDGRFLKLMERAGFTFYWITPESASATMIRNYRKGFAIDDVIRAADAIKGSPLRVRWSFLIGGPGETNHTLQETVDFTAKYLAPEAGNYTNTADYFLGVRVYPNTDLWRIALNEGFITENSDPAEPLWYLSEGLDLDRAVEQIGRLAERCPALSTGRHEKWLVLSPIAAFLARLLRMPKPYWGMSTGANQVMLKIGVSPMYWRKAVAAGIRRQLERQGYNWALMGKRDS